MKRGKEVGNEELGWLSLYSMASEFPCVMGLWSDCSQALQVLGRIWVEAS